MTIERPEIVTDEHLEYLDELRESGVTNMYGSPGFIDERFQVTKQVANEIVGYWMKSFGERHPT